MWAMWNHIGDVEHTQALWMHTGNVAHQNNVNTREMWMHPGSMDSSAELDNVAMSYVWARTGEDEWAVGTTVVEWFTSNFMGN